jgi:ethanolamine utilization protein EutM
VTALDVMLKTANVRLVARERIGAQRAAVLVRGDVASVRAAVDAAMEEVKKVSTLMSGHVIPRPDPVIMALFA